MTACYIWTKLRLCHHFYSSPPITKNTFVSVVCLAAINTFRPISIKTASNRPQSRQPHWIATDWARMCATTADSENGLISKQCQFIVFAMIKYERFVLSSKIVVNLVGGRVWVANLCSDRWELINLPISLYLVIRLDLWMMRKWRS